MYKSAFLLDRLLNSRHQGLQAVQEGVLSAFSTLFAFYMGFPDNIEVVKGHNLEFLDIER